jgi:formamidopyrimidine-DNA glycosylase
MNGDGNDMLYSSEIIGNVYIVELLLHKYITKDMQKRILEMNQLNGSFQSVNPVMINSIIKIIINVQQKYRAFG